MGHETGWNATWFTEPVRFSAIPALDRPFSTPVKMGHGYYRLKRIDADIRKK
ncbi:MAG TPA: hypothetical protein G4N96_14420 [Chloroflexi bacterium]|nr:hypothetical protein [Chloroflexota bacterium]